MDMEADLGIDSIKRVEIFGALTNKHPEMSGINPNELTELRTLAEIVSFVTGNSNAHTTTAPTQTAPAPTTPTTSTPLSTTQSTPTHWRRSSLLWAWMVKKK